jgi:hypothetical protein
MIDHVVTRNRFMVFLPVLADGVAFLAMLIWLPPLSLKLMQPSGWNALLLVLLYSLSCIGVYLIRKLEPQPGIGRWSPPTIFLNNKVRGALAFLFGLLMMTTVAYQLGYFSTIQSIRAVTMNEGNSSALFVYMPGALLGFSMLYILVLAFPVQANQPPGSNHYATVALLGLILANGMLLFTTAQVRAIVIALDLSPETGVALVSILVLLISFGPPRLLYQQRQPYLSGLVSLAILLLFATWQIMG